MPVKIRLLFSCALACLLATSNFVNSGGSEESPLNSNPPPLPSRGNIFRIGEKVKLSHSESALNMISVLADMDVDGQVLGDMIAIAGNVKLNPTAKVQGNVIAFLGNVAISDQSQVAGYTKSFSTLGIIEQILALNSGFPREFWGKNLWWGWKVCSFLAILALQLITVGIFPKLFENISAAFHEKLFGIGVIGGIVWVLAIPICLFLFLSVFGIPLLPIFLAFLIAATFFGRIGVFYWFGSTLTGDSSLSNSKYVCVSFGYLGYQVARSLPYFGKLTFLIVSILGLGICLRTQFGRKSIAYRNRLKGRKIS